MNKELLEKTFEMTKIMNRAVHNIQKDNLARGIPNVYSTNGHIYYELPDGSIVDKKTYEKKYTNERK